jgi:uncharacterized protein involved in exopolysaccharide biosynthesis
MDRIHDRDLRSGAEPDAVDLRKPLIRLKAAIVHHKLLIFVITALTVGATVAYMKLRPPVYVAECAIRCELDDDKSRDNFYDRWNVFRKNGLMSEAALIISGEPLMETTRRLDLKWDEVYHSVGSQVAYWWEHCALGKKYRELKQKYLGIELPKWEMSEEERELYRTFVDFKSGVTFEPVPDASVGSIRVMGPTPRVAEMADTIAASYVDLRQKRLESEAKRAYDALTPHVEQARQELDDLEDRMKATREQHDILFDFEKYQLILSQQTGNQAKVRELTAKVRGAEMEVASLEALLAAEEPEVRSGRVSELNPVKQLIEGKLINDMITLNEKSHLYLEDAPEVANVKKNIAWLREELEKETDFVPKAESFSINSTRELIRQKVGEAKAGLAGARAELGVYEAAKVDFDEQLKDVPEKQRLMHVIMRDYALADQKFRALHEKHISAKVSMDAIAGTTPTIQVVGRAIRPDKPVWPNTKLYVAVAVIVGLLMGVAAAYCRDIMLNRVRRHDLEGGRGLAPLYGNLSIGSNGDSWDPRRRGNGAARPAVAAGNGRARRRISESRGTALRDNDEGLN